MRVFVFALSIHLHGILVCLIPKTACYKDVRRPFKPSRSNPHYEASYVLPPLKVENAPAVRWLPLLPSLKIWMQKDGLGWNFDRREKRGWTWLHVPVVPEHCRRKCMNPVLTVRHISGILPVAIPDLHCYHMPSDNDVNQE